MDRSKIVIAGGSGFLGVSLARHLAKRNIEVVILARKPPMIAGPWRFVAWDARTLGGWVDELRDADGLVNLTGRSVNCIKTPDHKDEILRSRVESTSILGAAVRKLASPPPVWVQMSTAHIYGDPPTLRCTEASAHGMGLAPTVGQAWEEAFRTSLLNGQRGVVLRTSFVLGRNQGVGGGALTVLSGLARVGLGGRVGSGKQGMSWIHEIDLNRIIESSLSDARFKGVYIASSPKPVCQADFMRTLRKVVKMPIGLPAFEWMVRLAAPLILRTDPELALYGRYVLPKRLLDEGFQFEYSDLEKGLRQCLSRVEQAEPAV